MGQEQSVQTGSQRIKPTPGSSGLRRRRGTISIYSESNNQIHTLKITPETTVKQILSTFSEQSRLKLGDTILAADTILADLESFVFRLVDDQSTVGSSNGSLELKAIGPRPFDQQPQKPVNQSSMLASLLGDEPCEMNLTAIAVPDVRLRRKLRPTKSLYQLIQA